MSLKDRAELIAKYSSKTRELLGTQKSNDRTFTNSENNRGQNNEKSAENALYPLWHNYTTTLEPISSKMRKLSPDACGRITPARPHQKNPLIHFFIPPRRDFFLVEKGVFWWWRVALATWRIFRVFTP